MIDIGALYTRIEADTTGLNKAETKIASFAKKAAGYFAAIASVAAVGTAIKDATLATARYDTLGVVMLNVGKNAGYSANQIRKYEQQVKASGISMIKTREVVTRMTQAQIDLTKSSDLARIAQDAAVIGNIDSSEAFARMIRGIQSAEVEILRGIGLNVSFEQAYADFAATVGKTASELTTYEKTQARVTAVIKEGRKIQGTYTAAMDTSGKKWLSLNRQISDAQVILGKLFQPAFGAIVDKITESIKAFNESMDGSDLAFYAEVLGDVATILFNLDQVIPRIKSAIGTESLLGKGLAIPLDVLDQMRTTPPLMWKFVAAKKAIDAAIAAGGLRVPSFEEAEKAFKKFYRSTKESFMSLDEIVSANLKQVLQENYVDPWEKAARDAIAAQKGAGEAQARSLKTLQKEYKQHADAIKRITDEIAQNQQTGAELVRSLERTGMTEVRAWKDLRAEANEYATAAEKAVKAGDFEAAIRLADKAQDKYVSLNEEIKKGDRVLITGKAALATTIAGVKEMIALRGEALRGQKDIEITEANKLIKESDFTLATKLFDTIETKTNNITAVSYPAMGAAMSKAFDDGAITAETAFQKIGLSAKEIETTINQAFSLKEVDDGAGLGPAIQKIGDLYTNVYTGVKKESETTKSAQINDVGEVEKEIKLIEGVWTNVYDEAESASSSATSKMLSNIAKVKSAAGSIVYPTAPASGKKLGGTIQKLRQGGQAIMAQAGQYFPGYGGGDKIPIMGEAGEVMIKKESVREAGLSTSLAFNQGDWPKVIQNLLPKLRTGGPIAPMFPRQALATGGPVQMSADVPSETVRNYHIPGESSPLVVRANNREAMRLFSVLEQRYKRRS